MRDTIVMSRTENGRMMPVDQHGNQDGNLVYRDHPLHGHVVHVLTKVEMETIDPDVPRYMPHFATCKEKASAS